MSGNKMKSRAGPHYVTTAVDALIYIIWHLHDFQKGVIFNKMFQQKQKIKW